MSNACPNCQQLADERDRLQMVVDFQRARIAELEALRESWLDAPALAAQAKQDIAKAKADMDRANETIEGRWIFRWMPALIAIGISITRIIAKPDSESPYNFCTLFMIITGAAYYFCHVIVAANRLFRGRSPSQ
ncbi:MAG: hypothetical protein IKC80_00410 [Kiritimatiellae bacterium]|nr:hypothetical protein [Kiritimatiellia bacterium]